MIQNLLKQNQFLYNHYPELFVAINHHKTHNNKRISFENRLYLKNLYLDKSDNIVVKKSTQCGITEWLILKSTMKSYSGRNVFYVLPTYTLVSRFVKNRIDRTIEYTQFYKALLKLKYGKFSESMSLKHIGKGSIAFVGSNASSGFTEFPADDVIIDELDECDQENLPMTDERLSASEDPQRIKVGNPTLQDFGIDNEYNNSDKKQWRIKCSNCGKWILPDFFTHIVKEVGDNEYILLDEEYDRKTSRDIHIICNYCNKPFDRFNDGEWITQDEYSHVSGYHISKLFSTKVTIKELVDRFNKGLTDDTKLQRFYNGDLGIAYTASGSKITKEMLDKCKQNYSMPSTTKNYCVMGIDVGSVLNVKINEILPNGKLRSVYIGKIPNDLNTIRYIKQLVKAYKVIVGCVDADPEINLAKNICLLKNFFRIHFKNVRKDILDAKNKIITVDRTSWCDNLKSKILTKMIYLPKNADKLKPLDKSGLSEYYYHMTNPVRTFDEKKKSYKWVEGGNPDHYFFSEILSIIAKKILNKIL